MKSRFDNSPFAEILDSTDLTRTRKPHCRVFVGLQTVYLFERESLHIHSAMLLAVTQAEML